jgi:hypothetical protein
MGPPIYRRDERTAAPPAPAPAPSSTTEQEGRHEPRPWLAAASCAQASVFICTWLVLGSKGVAIISAGYGLAERVLVELERCALSGHPIGRSTTNGMIARTAELHSLSMTALGGSWHVDHDLGFF